MTAPISASLMPAAEISWREDLMSMPHCDTRSYPRQYVPVFARPHTPSYRPSMDMRSLLKALMALRDENAYALEERSGPRCVRSAAATRAANRTSSGMQSVAEHGATKGTGSLLYSSMCPARNPASRAMRMMSSLVILLLLASSTDATRTAHASDAARSDARSGRSALPPARASASPG